MTLQLPGADVLRIVIKQRGFRVKTLAVHVGLDVRTLERRFAEQFHITPKAWLIRERMTCAPPLLIEGLSNKEVAASLRYTHESNFCRDFKRYFGCTPQEFVHMTDPLRFLSHFDSKLSCFDRCPELPGKGKGER